MAKTINAIYEHGVFRPLEPVEDITENDEVEVTVSSKRDVKQLMKKGFKLLPRSIPGERNVDPDNTHETPPDK
jgi:predicted DNA-binding antitoxin AbrB/MazE fold protein